MLYDHNLQRLYIIYIKTWASCPKLYPRGSHPNSDWTGSVDDRKSMLGYLFHLGLGAISWASKKQLGVSFSTTYVEYVATKTTVCQVVWIRRMLRDLCHNHEGTTTNFCDNNSAITL